MEELFLKVLNMSIMAGYCVLIVCALRVLLRRLPKLYSYVLWAVVYFRLVCPVSFESVFSLIRVKPQTFPVNMTAKEAPQVIDEIRPVEIVEETGTLAYVGQAQPEPAGNSIELLLFAASVVWLLVAAGLLLHGVMSVYRLRKQLANAVCITENIYEAKGLETPFVLGVVKPHIYVPADVKNRQREIVLAHEKIHIRRRDYLVKQGAFFISCIHWFNPLVWLAFYLMCKDMEMSCDESVIRSMGKEVKKEYSESLLALASGRQFVNGSQLAFGERGIKSRIKNVLSYRRQAVWASVLLAVLVAGVMVGLALNPVEAAEKAEYAADAYRQESGKKTHENVEEPEVLQDSEAAQGLKAAEASEENDEADTEEGNVTPILHFYIPQDARDGMYADETLLSAGEHTELAKQALQELYNLTGTQIDECYYYYTIWGDFYFGLSEDDMEHQRFFLSRAFDGNACELFDGYIATMYVSNARRTWFSPVQQYTLPEKFETFSDSEKAVWFLTRSGLYQGETVADCIRPYAEMPETWRILMEEGTCYEVTLDKGIDSFADIAGPYPEWEINR